MKNALIVNGHVPYTYSKGELNEAYVSRATAYLRASGFQIALSIAHSEYDVEREVKKFGSADFVLFQFPLYNMAPPWALKKYFDDVFLAGGDGRLYAGDGRSRSDPMRYYGSGGMLNDKPYMLSVTCNAPFKAFDQTDHPFFGHLDLSGLLGPMHLALKFMNMKSVGFFGAYDVHKNPSTSEDFKRFDQELGRVVEMLK